VVDVEHRSLRALEEHPAVVAQGLIDQERGVGDERPQPLGIRELLLGHRSGIQPRQLVELLEDLVLRLERDLQLAHQDLGVEQILHADTHPGRLVLVAGPDAPARRADREPAQAHLGRPVQHHVVRHDQVRVAPDAQAAEGDAPLLERVELEAEGPGVDHRAVADHAEGVRVEDPGGNEVQLVDLIPGDDRVPGVVPPLVAHDDVAALGEEVHHLPLALVAPLGAHHDRGAHYSRARLSNLA
jgi:hypothetical protein